MDSDSGCLALRVVFDPAFDEGAWPGPRPRPDSGAVAGEDWVGPRGLAGLLETWLGLRAPATSASLRAAGLVPRLLETPGFWSASAAVDPLGTARRLLEWRDALALAGWRGEPLSERLDRLHRVVEGADPGYPDRLRALLERVSRLGSPLVSLQQVSPPVHRLERDLLDALARHGTRVSALPLGEAPATGDLAASRAGSFQAEGDGTLQLVRPHGPLEAADEVAAWLAAREDLDATLVLSPAPVLDAALRRHGLPTLGAGEPAGQGALLQVLPLVLACGWDPPDPQRALELLTLPVGPVRPGIARALAKALHEWPSVGSPRWTEALAAGLQSIPDPGDRDRLRARIDGFMDGGAHRAQGYPALLARTRTALLATWLRGRMGTEEGSPEPWAQALAQCAEFDALLAGSGLQVLSEAQLHRLVAAATDAARPAPAHPACAGLRSLSGPGGVAGPARCIVWWNFSLGTVATTGRLPLTREERARLEALGLELTDPGALARARADLWRRPLFQATEALVLVCPRTDDGGGEAFPHPLWDEVAVRAGDTARRLRDSRPFGPHSAGRRARTLQPVPRPFRNWRVAPGLARRERPESPSSLQYLLGCPFAWALRYAGGVWAGETARLSGEATLLGKVAHEIVERVLLERPADPAAASQRAEHLFDTVGPTLAAPLFLPGADAARAQARRVAAASAGALVDRLSRAGMQVQQVEQAFRRGDVGGRVDLVVGPPTTVLDLKWARARWYAERLKQGTAYQLAVYAYALAGPGGFPAVGYYTLLDQRLSLVRAGLFPGVEPLEGPDPEVTWRALEASLEARRAEIAEGRLEAPGNPDASGEGVLDEDGLVEGRLILAPPCRWCDCGVLCGLALAGEVAKLEEASDDES